MDGAKIQFKTSISDVSLLISVANANLLHNFSLLKSKKSEHSTEHLKNLKKFSSKLLVFLLQKKPSKSTCGY